jgi:hypothetical protein
MAAQRSLLILAGMSPFGAHQIYDLLGVSMDCRWQGFIYLGHGEIIFERQLRDRFQPVTTHGGACLVYENIYVVSVNYCTETC